MSQKAALLEKANTLLKKINPTYSVSKKNSVSQIQDLIHELERDAELEEMKSRVIDYEYVLKENEELKKEIEELKKDPKTSFKQCILKYKTDENGSTYGERCLWGKTDMRELIKESEKLHEENEEWLREFEEGVLVHSEGVICSHDDLSDYIFGRLKDICREENLPHHFCPVRITNELQSAVALKGENEKLKKENEKLKEGSILKRVVKYTLDENGNRVGEAIPVLTELEKLKGENEKLKERNEKLEDTWKKSGDILVSMEEEEEKLKAEIECWKRAAKKREKSVERKERKARAETLNFGDRKHSFYWAAENGEVVFWKVPEKLMELEDEDGECRVQSAMESFGEEWGNLMSHSIKTMTLAILEEHE